LLRNSSVTFFTDNQNAACIIKKGNKIPELQALVSWIYSICVYHNISLYAQWIPSEENEKRKQMLLARSLISMTGVFHSHFSIL
jgi:hypothetical protein